MVTTLEAPNTTRGFGRNLKGSGGASRVGHPPLAYGHELSEEVARP